MKENRKGKRRHQNNSISVLDEIKFDLSSERVNASDLNPMTEYVMLHRYEYDCLVGKVAVYDLLRDMIARSDYLDTDKLRRMLGIEKMPREEKKA